MKKILKRVLLKNFHDSIEDIIELMNTIPPFARNREERIKIYKNRLQAVEELIKIIEN